MICLWCKYYSVSQECCTNDFDNDDTYLPPCCRDDEDEIICTNYDYIGGIENE